MSRSKKTAIFVGAGASKPLGFPLTGDILPEVLRRLRDGSLFVSGSRPDEAQLDREDAAALLEFLEKLMPGLRGDGDELPLITDVLSLVDQLMEEDRVPFKGIRRGRLSDVRLWIERAILRVLYWPYDPKSPDAVPDLLRRWVSSLVQATEDPERQCVIVSTNYDVALETEIYRQLGLGDRQGGDLVAPVIDYGMSWRDVVSGEVWRRPDRPRFAIYKLHGSMNWTRCDLCDHVYVNPRGIISHQPFRRDVDQLNSCHCGQGPVRPVMVAPSFARSLRDTNLLAIWKAALEDLRTSTTWTVVGYSLPEEDIGIRSLLVRAFNARWDEPTPEVSVFLKGSGEKARYRLFFPECGFSDGGLEALIRGA